jgi:hypothetical protein
MGVGTRIRGGNGPSVWKDDPGLGDVVTNTTRAATATSS